MIFSFSTNLFKKNQDFYSILFYNDLNFQLDELNSKKKETSHNCAEI